MMYLKNNNKQKGQSLVWVLAFLATMAVTFAGVYSVGQTTSEKQKIVNTADAAAYTGAMVEARALNLTAYANRAEIANEVFIAQLVSLESWTAYFKQTINSFKNASSVLKAIPWIGIVFAVIEVTLKIIESAISIVESVLGPAVTTAINLVDVVYYKVAYQVATNVIFTPSSMQFAATNAAQNVTAVNLSNQNNAIDTAPTLVKTGALGLDNAYEWERAFDLYKKGNNGSKDLRENAKNILLASRDEFSKERNGTTDSVLSYLWGSNSFDEKCVASIGASKDGTTQLKNYERWEAQDTSEFGVSIGNCKGTSFGIPYGWGRSTASNKANDTSDIKLDPHLFAGGFAYNDNPKKHGGWSGVKELWDVKRDSNDNPVSSFNENEETLVFSVLAVKNKNVIKNNESLNFMNRASSSALGSTDLKSNYLDGNISAKASAKIFFSRPARQSADFTAISLFRNDSHKELSNLYNPYWQVRLTDVPVPANLLIYETDSFLIPFTQ